MFQAARGFLQSFTKVKDADNLEKSIESDNAENEVNFSSLLQKLAAAKDWTSFTYNRAVESGEKTAKHLSEKVKSLDIKSAAENIPWWREFDQSQTEFLSQLNANQLDKLETETVLLPWHPDVSGLTEPTAVENLKNKILSLSRQQNTFLLQPPTEAPLADGQSGEIINWSLARALLEADPHLAVMRYTLVPRKIGEDLFWRNYFYRLSVVRQSAQLSAMTEANSDEETVTVTSDDNTSDFVCVDENSIAIDSVDPKPDWKTKTRKSPSTHSEQKKSNVQPAKSKKHSSVLLDQNTVTKPTGKNLPESDAATEDFEEELSREIDEIVANTNETSQLSDDDLMYDAEFEDELLAELTNK